MTYRTNQPKRPQPRLPVLIAAAGAGAGFLVGYLAPIGLGSLGALSTGGADLGSCCMAPLLTIAGGVGGYFYGRQMEQKAR